MGKKIQKQIGDLCPHCKRNDVRFTLGKYWCVGCRTKDTLDRRERDRIKDPYKRRRQRQILYYAARGADPKSFYVKYRNEYLRRRYNISQTEIEQISATQGHVCPICEEPLGGDYRVEHDHRIATKRDSVRGIVCNQDNLLLGHAQDSIKRLRNAIAYLERAEARASFGGGAADWEVWPVENCATVVAVLINAQPKQEQEKNMMAVIEMPGKFCIVYSVKRQGLKVKIKSWCGVDSDAGVGVVQIPDSSPHQICPACRAAVAEMARSAPRPARPA